MSDNVLGRPDNPDGSPSEEPLAEPLFIAIPAKDPAMEDASDRAYATVPRFIELLQGERGDRHFSAKLPFRDPDESERRAEECVVYLWLVNIRYHPEDDDFTGAFCHVPLELQKWLKEGDYHVFEADRIFDWVVIEEDGRLHGGFTMRVIRDHLPESKREEYDCYIGASVYEPLPEPAVE